MNANLLRAELAKNGYTQSRLAKELDMAPSTFVRKMKNDSFLMSETKDIIRILEIKEPLGIFFEDMVT